MRFETSMKMTPNMGAIIIMGLPFLFVYKQSLVLAIMNLLYTEWNPLYDSIFNVIARIVILVVLFLIFRGILLWYWKINTIVNNQDKQTKLLQEIADKLDRVNTEE